VSAAEFISDWVLCIVLRGCWYDNIILDVHASTENESDGSRDGFCKESEQVFVHFSTVWETDVGYNWMVHKSFWFMLILVYWVQAQQTTKKL
jgi:hypothetical protein